MAGNRRPWGERRRLILISIHYFAVTSRPASPLHKRNKRKNNNSFASAHKRTRPPSNTPSAHKLNGNPTLKSSTTVPTRLCVRLVWHSYLAASTCDTYVCIISLQPVFFTHFFIYFLLMHVFALQTWCHSRLFRLCQSTAYAARL